jgi:hypothetical protein
MKGVFFIKKYYNFYRELLEIKRRELIFDLIKDDQAEKLKKKNLNKKIKSECGDDDEYDYEHDYENF